MEKVMECENGSKVHIISNYHIRDLLCIEDLQYMGLEIPDWIDPQDYDFGYQFFTYRGEVYCTADFTAIGGMWSPIVQDWQKGWNGYLNDSDFSGILIRYAEIPDSYGDYGIQVATFY